MYGAGAKNHEHAAERDRNEWETFNSEGLGRRITYHQYQTEAAGRLLDFHDGINSGR